MDEWREAITELVRPYVRAADARALDDPDAELAALGVDSLAVVELIVLIERRFSVTFSSDLLDWSTFRTVTSIADTVAALRGPAGTDGPDPGDLGRPHSPNRFA
ncbi:phosphopantetheine-binding protein [Micromonospora rubida]|uniref:phosphopantetheine-binding protein n=1 Tax=Micromonospora rubida TaxID=2697657 RepID=UPI001378968D|nr:phosphopantetheine-binding protein [Micromonospora rubida]NBE83258.1 acyl carrier protein [Micromonospora rubida]